MSEINIIQKQFRVKRQQMRSGIADAASREYEKINDKQGCVWLYRLECDDPGSTIYHHDPKDTKSQGFGGSTLTFKIAKTGEEYKAKGPWHSNSDALYEATEVDLRDKHLTFGAVSLSREYENYETVLIDVLYVDEAPTLGLFERIKLKAQELSNQLNRQVFYYSESSGGSSCGPVNPKSDDDNIETYKRKSYPSLGNSQKSIVEA